MHRNLPDFHAQRTASARYYGRWRELLASGARPVVLNRSANPEPWKAWLAYFRDHGMPLNVELMRERAETTVPCWWPSDFEPVEAVVDRRAGG